MIYTTLLIASLSVLLASGMETTRRRCQDRYAYFPTTTKCYRLNSVGPCGALETFQLAVEEPRRHYVEGKCTCARSIYVGFLGRVQRCFLAFEKGPCGSGEWLVPVIENPKQLQCQRIPCPALYNRQNLRENGSDSPKDRRSQYFVFAHNGTCYTHNSRRYCSSYQEILKYNGVEEPECQHIGGGGGGGYGSGTASITCADGKSPDATGGCSPLAAVSDYDY